MPKDGVQAGLTDTEGRIMKRARGGCDCSYIADTAVDATGQIAVATELTRHAADDARLPVLRAAVNFNVARDAVQVLVYWAFAQRRPSCSAGAVRKRLSWRWAGRPSGHC